MQILMAIVVLILILLNALFTYALYNKEWTAELREQLPEGVHFGTGYKLKSSVLFILIFLLLSSQLAPSLLIGLLVWQLQTLMEDVYK